MERVAERGRGAQERDGGGGGWVKEVGKEIRDTFSAEILLCLQLETCTLRRQRFAAAAVELRHEPPMSNRQGTPRRELSPFPPPISACCFYCLHKPWE